MATNAMTLNYVRNLVRQRAGIVLDEGKDYLIESRLATVAHEMGLASIEDVIARARTPANTNVESRVVEALTTNETTFFRDMYPFEALRETVIPQLMKARAATRTLRIWSAASSTGQEPYSIAMTLREHFPELKSWRVRILATDLAEGILDRAKLGRYRQIEVNRGLPASLLVKYFTRDGNDWVISPELRAMVDFSAFNLVTDMARYPACDIAFVRNVLIYFDLPTKQAVLRRVREVLAPDGVLFLGGTEGTTLDDVYERVVADKAAFYRPRKSAR